MQWAEVYDIYDRLMRVATHASGQFLVELGHIFTDRRVPSTGARQSGGKAVGALHTPQPRSLPDVGGGNRAALKTEVQEVIVRSTLFLAPSPQRRQRKRMMIGWLFLCELCSGIPREQDRELVTT